MRTRYALVVLALLALTGCAAPTTEPSSAPTAEPAASAGSSPTAEVGAGSCAVPTTDSTAGAAPVIDCIYPDPEAYVLCTKRTQRLPLELRWAAVNADRVFIAYGSHDDAEPVAFTGTLPPVGVYDGGGELRHECAEVATAYTITAKGEGGMTSEVFHLQTRLP